MPSVTVATAAQPVMGAVTVQLADQVPKADCQLAGGKVASLNCSLRAVKVVSAAAGWVAATPSVVRPARTAAMAAATRTTAAAALRPCGGCPMAPLPSRQCSAVGGTTSGGSELGPGAGGQLVISRDATVSMQPTFVPGVAG